MKKIRKIIFGVIALILMAGISNMGILRVQAASPTIKKEIICYWYPQTPNTFFQYIQNQLPDAKITDLKNTNPDVVEVTIDDKYEGVLRIHLLKKGTAKISIKYAGKTLTQKITVLKYENPCQLFKVGSTNYTKYFNRSGHFDHNNRKKDITATINIKPKKGWRLTKIEVQNMYTGTKKAKNNSKIVLSIEGTGTGVHAYFKNIKTGVVQELFLGYSCQKSSSKNYYD